VGELQIVLSRRTKYVVAEELDDEWTRLRPGGANVTFEGATDGREDLA
jgi:hypothetical protein